MIFLLQTCGDIISFSPTYNGVRFFSKIISHERYLFLVEEFFPQVFPYKNFFSLEIILQEIFSDAEITPYPKVKWSASKGNQQQ